VARLIQLFGDLDAETLLAEGGMPFARPTGPGSASGDRP